MYKFNNGHGAIICDECRVVIAEDLDVPQDDFRLCKDCESATEEKPYTVCLVCSDPETNISSLVYKIWAKTPRTAYLAACKLLDREEDVDKFAVVRSQFIIEGHREVYTSFNQKFQTNHTNPQAGEG